MGWDKPDRYLDDAIGNSTIIHNRKQKSVDLRSLLIHVNRFASGKLNSATEILKSGSLGRYASHLNEYAAVHEEGTKEIIQWLKDKACKEVRAFAGI